MQIRISQSFLPLAAFLAVVCNATPIPGESSIMARDYLYSLEARDGGLASLDARDNDFSYLDAREYLEARDELAWLVARALGPGMQHKQESTPPVATFHPVPDKTYFPTHKNVYTGAQVNSAAGDLMSHIPSADPFNRKANSRLKTYPKPGTGFRNSEAANPAPNAPGTVAYHTPLNPPKRASTLPAKPGGSVQVGTDRLVAYRKAGDTAHTIGVSYHDPKKPIPPPAPGGTPSRNHPFTMAPQKDGGKVKAGLAKAGKKLTNALSFKKL